MIARDGRHILEARERERVHKAAEIDHLAGGPRNALDRPLLSAAEAYLVQ